MRASTGLVSAGVRFALRAGSLAGAALAGAHVGLNYDVSDAHHRPDDPDRHLTSMHHSQTYWDEFWCVDRSDVAAWAAIPSIPATIADQLEQVMTGGGGDDWHRLDDGFEIYLKARTDERFKFDFGPIDCDLLTAEDRDRVKIEFRMREVDEVCDADGQAPYEHPDWIGCQQFPPDGFIEYQGYGSHLYSIVQLDTNSWIDSSLGRSVVNHELGHAFGLADPVPESECAGMVSIMHTPFYCGDEYDLLEYPSSGDKSAVTSIMSEK